MSILCDTSVALPELIRICRDKLSRDGERTGEFKRRFRCLRDEHALIRQKGWEARPKELGSSATPRVA